MIKKLMNISGAQVLSKEEMRTTKGGGTCGYLTSTGTIDCGVSKEAALFMVANGGRWCCDSCHTSSYCR